MKRKNIIYIGSDENITDRLQEYYKFRWDMGDHSLYSIDKIDTSLDEWAEQFNIQIQKFRPHLIFVDFSDFEDDLKRLDVLNFLELVKGHQSLRGIVIVGIFSSVRELEKNRVIFSLGIVYTAIKGTASEFVKDAHYMAFDGGVRFERYATAGNMRLPHKIKMLGSIVSITPDLIEADFDIEADTGEKVEVVQHIFEDFTCDYLNNKESHDGPLQYSYMRRGSLEIEYPGPWDEVSDDQLQKETVETWVDLNLEKQDSTVGKVLVVSKNYFSSCTLELIKNQKDLIIKHVSNIDSSFNVIGNHQPDLIVIELNDQDDKEDEQDDEFFLRNDYSHLTRVLHYVGSSEYEKTPLVVTFNNPSTSVATQKVLKYSQIMSIHDKYSCDAMAMLLNSFAKKREEAVTDEKKYVFSNEDCRRVMEFPRDCLVTSINEHEFTFISKEQLPLFGTFRLDIPATVYLTLIPPIRYIQGDPIGQHYMAFVHGADESKLREIRRFVNNALQKPLEKFEKVQMKPSLTEEREVEKEILSKKEEKKEEKKDMHEEYVVDRSKTYNGISKL